MTPAASAGEPGLAAWRAEFPILGSTTYLISNSLGAMPRGAAAALERYARTWGERGVRAWEEGWWEMPVTVGDMVGAIIGAPKGSVTMHQNVTLAEAVVLSCFEPRGARDRIVFEDANFHSVQYLYAAQAGLRVTPVPVERLVDAIDERTLLVPVSHVLYKSAFVQDVPAIVEKAHRVGAHVVLDVYHSAGVLPVDVTALGVDFAVGGCLKWLCGGPGNGFLYVRPDLAHLAPRLTGWMAHAAPFAFEPPPIRRAEGPFRFLNGTPSIPCLYAALEGLRILREVGAARVRAHSERLTARLLARIDEAGFPSLTPREAARRGGTVAVDPPDAEAISRRLLERDILIDYRPGAGIRIAPHFYNTEDECDAVIAEIAALAAGRPALRATRH
ncbi:MAG TPA: aminotransferase class V-fold PLP-dependent enzyme [Gemmatimonadales bacterium]|nr:aminotransferase class V-fold PLP-dependent enzyme [Gemmatimonadales bacterium]